MVLAGYYLNSGRTEDAAQVLVQAEALGAQTHGAYPGILARVYDLGGDLVQATPLYRKAVARNPDDSYLNWYLGQALYRNGQPIEAVAFLRRAKLSDVPELQLVSQQLLDCITQDSGAGR